MAADPLRLPRLALLQAALCLLFVHGVFGSTLALTECKRKNAEQGCTLCKDAFHATYDEHKAKLLFSPKRTGCCVSHSVGACMEYAFTEAHCDPKEQNIAILIRKQVEEAQSYINKLAEYIGTLLCGDFNREHCGDNLMHHFKTAMYNITVVNGAPTMACPSVFTACLVGLLGAVHAYRLV